jgi:hypothetical protein
MGAMIRVLARCGETDANRPGAFGELLSADVHSAKDQARMRATADLRAASRD